MLLPLALSLLAAFQTSPPALEVLRLEGTPAPESVTVELVREADSRRVAPWPAADQRPWLFVRSANSQENIDGELPSREGDAAVLPRPVGREEVTLVGLDLRPWIETASLDTLREFMERHCARIELAEGDAEVRLRRVESAKLLLREGDSTPSATSMSKTGQPVELRPMVDPSLVPIGSAMPFKVYTPGGGAGVRVTARHPVSRTTFTFLTNKDGQGHFDVSHTGRWIVEAHALRTINEADADFELASATLVFDVVQGGAK